MSEKRDHEREVGEEAARSLDERLATIGLSDDDLERIIPWIHGVSISAYIILGQCDDERKAMEAISAGLSEISQMAAKP